MVKPGSKISFYCRLLKRVKGEAFFVSIIALASLLLFSCQPDKHSVADASISYYQHIAPIIATHCLKCHNDKGPGPINLNAYANVRFNAEMIRYVINRHIMPPWLADDHGWDFANKRVLSTSEIDTINKWIDNGLYKGDSTAGPAVAILAGLENRKPDIIFCIDKPLFIKGNNRESFLKTSFPFKNDSAFPVEAIEIVSKQMKVAHHAYYVIKGKSGFSRSAGEFLLGNDLFKDTSVVMISAWAPGSGGITYPDGFGFYLPKEGEVDLEFHYGPSPIDLSDSIEVHLYKALKPITRTCTFLSIANDDSVCHLNPSPFEIQPDRKQKFTMQYTVSKDLTVLMVAPHMHYLGKSYHASVVESDGKESQIINLANWNFSWQDQYLCQPFHKLQKGNVLKVEAEFDNTRGNLKNPNNPPKLVRSGWETRSEMMVFILMVTPYMPGDELLTWKHN
jgi:hypothetical protein